MKNQAGGAEESGETIAEAAGATCDQHNSNKSTGIGMATGCSLPSAELQTAHSNARINVCDFNLLHNYFLHMFESSEDTNVLKDKHKKNKKSKAKCPKSREKRPMEPLSSLYYSVPEIKISRNASWFAMFASVRRTCLEHQSRAATLLQVVYHTFTLCFCHFMSITHFFASRWLLLLPGKKEVSALSSKCKTPRTTRGPICLELLDSVSEPSLT